MQPLELIPTKLYNGV